MQRMTREQVRVHIFVGLSVLKPATKRALGIDIERVREEVADDLTHRIMGTKESEAVILKPDRVANAEHGRHGRWHDDEPHPDTYLPPVDPLDAYR